MADVSPEIIFNPLEVGYTDNPFPHLQEMRRLDPVHASPIGTWMLFDYDDCFQLLRDPALSVDEKNLANFDQERLAAFLDAVDGDVEELERTSILGIDPPDHTRLRRLVSKAFTHPGRFDAGSLEQCGGTCIYNFYLLLLAVCALSAEQDNTLAAGTGNMHNQGLAAVTAEISGFN